MITYKIYKNLTNTMALIDLDQYYILPGLTELSLSSFDEAVHCFGSVFMNGFFTITPRDITSQTSSSLVYDISKNDSI